MTYSIKNKRQEGDTLFTFIEYIFTVEADGIGKSIEVSVPHFQPQSIEEIVLGINNRAASELRALLAAKKIQEDLINNL